MMHCTGVPTIEVTLIKHRGIHCGCEVAPSDTDKTLEAFTVDVRWIQVTPIEHVRHSLWM